MSTTTEEIAAILASFDCKIDQAKVAALLNLPKSTIRGRFNTAWKPTAMRMIDAAKASGRMNRDGSVNEANLPASKDTPKRVKKAIKPDSLHGVKAGKVTKKAAVKTEPGKPSRRKAAKDGSIIKDEDFDRFLAMEDEF